MTGAVVGAGSSLWAEHKVRRTIRRTADAVQPDALVRQAARTARDAAEAAGSRVSGAIDAGRVAMRRREAELWAGLATAGHGDVPVAGADPADGRAARGGRVGPEAGGVDELAPGDASGAGRRRRGREAGRSRRRPRRRRAGTPANAH